MGNNRRRCHRNHLELDSCSRNNWRCVSWLTKPSCRHCSDTGWRWRRNHPVSLTRAYPIYSLQTLYRTANCLYRYTFGGYPRTFTNCSRCNPRPAGIRSLDQGNRSKPINFCSSRFYFTVRRSNNKSCRRKLMEPATFSRRRNNRLCFASSYRNWNLINSTPSPWRRQKRLWHKRPRICRRSSSRNDYYPTCFWLYGSKITTSYRSHCKWTMVCRIPHPRRYRWRKKVSFSLFIYPGESLLSSPSFSLSSSLLIKILYPKKSSNTTTYTFRQPNRRRSIIQNSFKPRYLTL